MERNTVCAAFEVGEVEAYRALRLLLLGIILWIRRDAEQLDFQWSCYDKNVFDSRNKVSWLRCCDAKGQDAVVHFVYADTLTDHRTRRNDQHRLECI